MSPSDIVIIIVGLVTVVGSIVSVVWVISNRPTYKHCNSTYQRIDLHAQQYETILTMLGEIKAEIAKLKDGS